MGAKSRVGRPSKNTLRVELRLDTDDEVTKELVKEAARRGVRLQQHIQDILIARFLHQPEQRVPEQQQEAKSGAAALADEFLL